LSFLFETHDVDAGTGAWVQERLRQGLGGWVHGAAGTGKSHAVRAAVQQGLRVDVAPGPLLGQRFTVDLARQLGSEGRSMLEAARHEGLSAALEIAERAVNGHPLVVDSVDRLLGDPAWSLDEPAAALWQQEKSTILSWLRSRLEHSPTILVSRRRPLETVPSHRHETSGWPISLKRTPDGYRDWPRLARLARGNPAVLTLARALVPLLPAAAFNALLEQAEEDEASVGMLLQRIGRAFQASAPPSWQQALALLAVLGEAPRDALVPVLRERPGRGLPAREPEAPVQAPSALERLLELGLIKARPGGLALLPALTDAGVLRPLTHQEHSELLPAVAHRLLAPVNDLRSLQPEHADRVLRAHALFVELGDMASAERTAVLHVHGLVELARRTSLDERYEDAWRQYEGLLRMMQSSTWGLGDETGRRLRSYVRHYRAWNGAQAGALDDATCLVEYQAALADWPENALWHQRAIEGLVRLGRLVEARHAVEEAYQVVEEHPRRDELLRVRPARIALRAGAPLLALELIEPVLEAPAELYPEVADGRDALLQRWAEGLPLSELPWREGEAGSQGCVVFLRRARVSVQRNMNGWVARLPELGKEGRASSPLAAVETLGRSLGEEARQLISTPSSHLSDRDVHRRGHLLSLVDALNSDIGLERTTERWLVGRVEGGHFVPVMRELPTVELPAGLMPESPQGLYLARVPVYCDGVPSGPVTAMEPAGSGRSLEGLIELLARMSEATTGSLLLEA
jgi:hypothetical protein